MLLLILCKTVLLCRIQSGFGASSLRSEESTHFQVLSILLFGGFEDSGTFDSRRRINSKKLSSLSLSNIQHSDIARLQDEGPY